MMVHDVELGPNPDEAVQVVVGHDQDEVVVPEQVIPNIKTLRCRAAFDVIKGLLPHFDITYSRPGHKFGFLKCTTI